MKLRLYSLFSLLFIASVASAYEFSLPCESSTAGVCGSQVQKAMSKQGIDVGLINCKKSTRTPLVCSYSSEMAEMPGAACKNFQRTVLVDLPMLTTPHVTLCEDKKQQSFRYNCEIPPDWLAPNGRDVKAGDSSYLKVCAEKVRKKIEGYGCQVAGIKCFFDQIANLGIHNIPCLFTAPDCTTGSAIFDNCNSDYNQISLPGGRNLCVPKTKEKALPVSTSTGKSK
jgi:hypothetical protein